MVLHVRALPADAMDAELHALAQPFGQVVRVLILKVRCIPGVVSSFDLLEPDLIDWRFVGENTRIRAIRKPRVFDGYDQSY